MQGIRTYRVVFADLAGPAGVAVVLPGSATRIIRVTKVQIAKPSVAQAPLRMRKTSTAHTGGTSTTPTPVPLDSGNPAASAVLRLYTVVPAGGGAVVGAVFDADIATTEIVLEEFGSLQSQDGQALVLRGVAEGLAIQLSAAATLNGYLEWTEE